MYTPIDVAIYDCWNVISICANAAQAEYDALKARIAQLETERDQEKAWAQALRGNLEYVQAERDETGAAYAAKCYTVAELQRMVDELIAERDERNKRISASNAMQIAMDCHHTAPDDSTCWPCTMLIVHLAEANESAAADKDAK